ncbi:MAG: hypothetical protein A2287_03550 [Candidatus Melainabacteria bacterium RIFOXYA12_FULL_32_12]|nr:MAG: hypothetical protein A2255_10895 [Candidatus Melainabacteria bacterium RIFOXYA2_FULL_32_9]OGI30082.1 MAG: hypothetical protein A2287_03550 [Candidatus Melainabacteria bacterium RIFOXYA12_FULL_32_12]
MPRLGPQRGELIKELKQLGTKVIVNTHNWYGNADEARKAGMETCEGVYGADKYVYQPDKSMLIDSIQAITEGKKIPKYIFQEKPNIPSTNSSTNNQRGDWLDRVIDFILNANIF